MSKKEFKIKYIAKFKSPHKKNDLRIWFAKPTTSRYQKIHSFSVSHKPKNSYKDNQGNQILYFKYSNPDNLKLEVDIEVTLSKENSRPIRKRELPHTKPGASYRRYLKSENFLEHTKGIKKLVNELTDSNNDNKFEDLQDVFEFVAGNFKYCYPVKKRGVKNINLLKPVGDCGEYSALLVTMSRVLNIPAVDRTGYVIFPSKRKIMEHGWASILSTNSKWVDLDAQYASIEKNLSTGKNKYFLRRSDYRIIFVNGFNIPLKPKIPKGHKLDYWKKIGLPVSNNSAQVIQPIIFASKNKVKFHEKFQIK